jgi:tRNA A-37 threonylcarbamoyl transferase component Bud32
VTQNRRPDVEELLDKLRTALSDRYTLGSELGRGGMSVVYRARDLRHNRDVAVKILRPELSATLGPQRFVREVQIASRLQHPHILPLYDSAEAAGLLYYVMPCVEGESLGQRLGREQELPITEAVRIAREVGAALSYAHEQGIVHRDIKPGNILLSSGIAMVADFGVARAMVEAAEDRMTDSAITVGTPGYMSPEQAGGEQRLDGRSDVYSLGCVLFEMLAGEPPFTGPTPKAVLARHMQQPPPSLRVVRPTVPEPLQAAIERALAKSPADRFRTAADFVAALEAAEKAARDTPPPTPVTGWKTIAAAGAMVAGALAIWLAFQPAASFDQNKVVVFPVVERGFPPGDTGAGYNVALVIEAALEHTHPLKWIDGWSRLDPRLRTSAALVTPGVARGIAKNQHARYFIDGAVRRHADSVTLILRLNDAVGDSLIAQSSAAGKVDLTPPHQLGLIAIRRLLPTILDPGRRIDLTPLSERRAASVALWIQGEREYRRARFAEAFDFYLRAVAEDSALAFAAIKGAQAAHWMNRSQEAESLTVMALAHQTLLPGRYVDFAKGLQAYLRGSADSAMMWLQRAVTAFPEWGEGAMALGEVYYHLFPRAAPLDSIAEATFTKALADDTTFTPPLFHLAEIALRRGDTKGADRLISRLQAGSPNQSLTAPLVLALRCLRQGVERTDWRSAALTDVAAVVHASRTLSGGASQSRCAEQGFRSVLFSEGVPPAHTWGALLGLQGLLIAEGRNDEALRIIDSAVAAGTPAALTLYILDLWAGAPMEQKAAEVDQFARERFGPEYRGVGPSGLWQLGVWHAWRGDAQRVSKLQGALRTKAEEPGGRRAGLFADALAAHLALVRSDTALAIRLLRTIAPIAPFDSLTWLLADALPIERLLLARLLLARGATAEAFHVATAFDHQGPISYVPFVPLSLAIRVQAADALGWRSAAARARARLASLGREDLLRNTVSVVASKWAVNPRGSVRRNNDRRRRSHRKVGVVACNHRRHRGLIDRLVRLRIRQRQSKGVVSLELERPLSLGAEGQRAALARRRWR